MHTLRLTACWIYIETTESAGPASRTPESSQNSTGTLGHWDTGTPVRAGKKAIGGPHAPAGRTHAVQCVGGD